MYSYIPNPLSTEIIIAPWSESFIFIVLVSLSLRIVRTVESGKLQPVFSSPSTFDANGSSTLSVDASPI